MGCASLKEAQAPEKTMRLDEAQVRLYAAHDEVLLQYESLELRYLELELSGRIEGAHKEGLSKMRMLYLEMQSHFGAVLEFHNRTLQNQQEVLFDDLDALDSARDDFVHYRGVQVLRAHHQRLMALHRHLIALSQQEGLQELVEDHLELFEIHRSLMRLCGEKMRLLEEDFGVDAAHEELLEPFELLPEEDLPDGPQLI